MGAIFCHVRIIKVCIHSDVWITWGSQKWKGAAPILIARAMEMVVLIIEIELDELFEKISIEEKIKRMDAMAWAMKYLMAVSVDWGFILFTMMGIKLIRLISNPNQQINQEEEEVAIKVPKIRPLR